MITSNTTFRDFLSTLQALHDDPQRAHLYADTYLAIHAGSFPIIEGNTAHFIYRAAHTTTVGIHAEWNGWNALRSLMTPIGGGLLHYERAFEEDARLDYLFAEIANDQLSKVQADPYRYYDASCHMRLDVLNAHQGASGFGARSELAMPTYQRPENTKIQAGIARGTLERGTIKSHILGQERSYTVYLPPNYDVYDGPYASVYFHDGGDYLTMGYAPTILDNLIHSGSIPPIVAIFTPPVDRDGEYNCNDAFVRYFCDELVPEMHRLFTLEQHPRRRAVIGPSLGGLISLYIACQRPEVFGLVGAQSTATKSVYGLNHYDAASAFAIEPRLPLKVHLAIGSYELCFATNFSFVENQGCRDLLSPVQELVGVLDRCGYAYRYREEHQGHSWGLWRDTLPDVLTYLFASL